QDPPARLDQGIKKRRIRKDAEHSKKSSKSKEYAKGKTPSNTSKTGKSVSAGKSVHEPEYIVQIYVEELNLENVANDADEPQADTILNILKKDWFKKSPRHETFDPDWNTVKTLDDAPKQSWFNEMIQAEKPPLTFDELMSTLIDFSTFAMNRLKLNKIHQGEDLVPAKCHKSSIDMSKPLPLQDKEGPLTILVEFFFNNDLEYLKARNKERAYSSSITKTPATRKSKKKWLMRVDEIHKLCNGTFQSVRNILRERLLNFEFGYNKDMPLREWTTKDKRRTGIMLNKIDDQLFKRRVLDSLGSDGL
ncbi:hypothetical protein Tco_0371724, partial [Tanacetum coccineum]